MVGNLDSVVCNGSTHIQIIINGGSSNNNCNCGSNHDGGHSGGDASNGGDQGREGHGQDTHPVTLAPYPMKQSAKKRKYSATTTTIVPEEGVIHSNTSCSFRKGLLLKRMGDGQPVELD